MPLQHIETVISDKLVKMKLGDNPDVMKATEFVEFTVPIALLTMATGNGDVPLGDLNKRYLASIQQSTLRYVRDAIGEETRRLANLAGR